MKRMALIVLANVLLQAVNARGQSPVDLSAGSPLSPSVDLGVTSLASTSGAGGSGIGIGKARGNAQKMQHAALAGTTSHSMNSGSALTASKGVATGFSSFRAANTSHMQGPSMSFRGASMGTRSSFGSSHSSLATGAGMSSGHGSSSSPHGAENKKDAIKAMLGPGRSKAVSRSLGLPKKNGKP